MDALVPLVAATGLAIATKLASDWMKDLVARKRSYDVIVRDEGGEEFRIQIPRGTSKADADTIIRATLKNIPNQPRTASGA